MTIKKILICFVAALLLLTAIVLFRTWQFKPAAITPIPKANIAVNSQQIAEHLSQAVQFKTISKEHRSEIDYQQFSAFISWLAQIYPDVHQQLELKKFNDYTLLFHWRGSEAHNKAILLSAHYDVVPVIAGTESLWSHPPFAGTIDSEHVWGRGTLDDKGSAITLMEAITHLLAQDYRPKRDVYIALTHDEEIGSKYGAAAIADYFADAAIALEWSLDEGSFVLDGMIPGVEPKVASINVTEKGYLTLELIAHAKGGHSSMPPSETAVSILAQAIVNLKNAPVPGGLEGISAQIYDKMARHMPFSSRVLFANKWLFGSLIENKMSEMNSANAMLRTTTAPTMLSGSEKSNVLPIEAKAKVNFRIHPRDSVESIIAYVNAVIDDPRIEIGIVEQFEPSPVSSSESPAFKLLANAAQSIHGDLVVVPGLTVGGTDSRRYQLVADDSYRFLPMTLTSQELTGFHGTNEKISIENLTKAVQFYNYLIKQSDQNL
ncbi:M20 family peptidase [Pseudoalteromonas gelatinilytica]|uniref:M20 family peptidase n=1 Tax=Pseudoalteromonas gelatinilytica TaxID=1703256 RepID=UPI00166C86BF|nr:M20 family peptidase [Pseudoalteromonas profundi]